MAPSGTTGSVRRREARRSVRPVVVRTLGTLGHRPRLSVYALGELRGPVPQAPRLARSSIERCHCAVCETWLNVKMCSARDVGRGVRERGRERLAGTRRDRTSHAHQLAHHPPVLLQVAGGVGHADPRADRHQLRQVGHPGHAQVHRKRDARLRASRRTTRRSRSGLKHICVVMYEAYRCFSSSTSSSTFVGDVGVALRVAGHADLVERDGRARRSRAAAPARRGSRPVSLASPPTTKARPKPAARAAGEQLAQMRAVADHVRRQVRGDVVPARRRAPRIARRWPRSRARARPSP